MQKPDLDLADILFALLLIFVIAVMTCGCVQPPKSCTDDQCAVGQHKEPPQSVPSNTFYGMSRQIDRDLSVVCYFGNDGRMSCVYIPYTIPKEVK